MTVVCRSFREVHDAVHKLRSIDGFDIVQLKNKFQNPTPLGYRDVNMNLQVTLSESKRKHICEVQINHTLVLEAKEKAHKPYEGVREQLPVLCKEASLERSESTNPNREETRN